MTRKIKACSARRSEPQRLHGFIDRNALSRRAGRRPSHIIRLYFDSALNYYRRINYLSLIIQWRLRTVVRIMSSYTACKVTRRRPAKTIFAALRCNNYHACVRYLLCRPDLGDFSPVFRGVRVPYTRHGCTLSRYNRGGDIIA